MSKSLKLLVCGDVRGRFVQLFTRVSAIQKKAGQFDMLFCVGDFFGNDDAEWQQVTSGTIKVPITTYVLGPNKPEGAQYFSDAGGCELHENITYLGRRGLYTGSSGLTVVYLSGVEVTDGKQNALSNDCRFTAADVDELRQSLTGVGSHRGIDLLLTSQWPRGVDKYGTPPDGVDSNAAGSALISQLALAVKPRYHFCAREGVSYERQPYRNHRVLMEAAQHVTRFVALADVSTEHKRKYLYAFNIVPLRQMDTAELTKQPSDVTECPFKVDNAAFKAKQPPVRDEKSTQYFYDARVIERGTTLPERGGKRRSQHGGPPPKKPPQPTGPCWFCLASPQVEKHLVVSVGTQCYLALAKGGLTDEHILILPVGHYQSTVSSPSDVGDEIELYKSALRKYFAKSSRSVAFFERNYKTQHLQIQAVPVSASGADVMEAFMSCAERQNIELRELPKFSDLKQIAPSGAPYFYAEIPGDIKLYCQISRGFPLQFGREAMTHASLLNMPDRVDWKQCTLTKPQETEHAASFRQKFKEFDFTLD